MANHRKQHGPMFTSALIRCIIYSILILTIIIKPIQMRQTNSGDTLVRMKKLIKTFFGRALELSRESKWNEFMEEQNSKLNRAQNQPKSTFNHNKTAIHQNIIDETKDPNSPYYIAMISSNIGGQYYNVNRTNSITNSFGNAFLNKSMPISKLFNYAFTSVPSRAILTTKRPLITYINVSNLEEHDSDENNQVNTVPDTQQPLSLLNSAEPGSAILQTKKRLPECATQQVCSAHYVRSNHTQRLCDCPRDINWNCEDSDPNEIHTIDLSRKQELQTLRNSLEVYTQVKLCENLSNIKPCKTPTDWTIMALQSERTGKAHFVVVCKCPESSSFEGPFTHKHPPYARFPGIRVYGMLCNQGTRKSKQQTIQSKALEIDLEKVGNEYPEFPWELAYAVINSTATQGFW